jgi:hypothetical protein
MEGCDLQWRDIYYCEGSAVTPRGGIYINPRGGIKVK